MGLGNHQILPQVLCEILDEIVDVKDEQATEGLHNGGGYVEIEDATVVGFLEEDMDEVAGNVVLDVQGEGADELVGEWLVVCEY